MNINAFPSIAKLLGLKFYKHLIGDVQRKSIKQIKGCGAYFLCNMWCGISSPLLLNIFFSNIRGGFQVFKSHAFDTFYFIFFFTSYYSYYHSKIISLQIILNPPSLAKRKEKKSHLITQVSSDDLWTNILLQSPVSLHSKYNTEMQMFCVRLNSLDPTIAVI